MRVLATYAVKGGVGKTTTAVNLAALSARSGRRTLLWDLDTQGAATYLLNVKPKVKGGSLGLLTGDRALDKATRDTDVPGLHLLPADVSLRTPDLSLEDSKKPDRQLIRVLKTVRDDYDLVVLDCPPGLTLLSENVFRAADLVLVPMIPTPLSVHSYELLVGFLDDVEGATKRVHPFFSMVDGRKTLHTEVRRELMLRTTRTLTAWVPMSSVVERMSLRRQPVVVTHPTHPVSVAYGDIWSEVVGLLA